MRKRTRSPEGALTTEILRALRAAGLLCFRNNTGRRGTIVFGLGLGSPDIVGVLPPDGRLVAFEVKMPKKALTADQKRWLASVEERGAYGARVESVAEALQCLRQARGEMQWPVGTRR